MDRKNKGRGMQGDNAARKDVGNKPQASEFDRLTQEAEKKQSRKPGSQSNSSKQRNNGRGGGK